MVTWLRRIYSPVNHQSTVFAFYVNLQPSPRIMSDCSWIERVRTTKHEPSFLGTPSIEY